MLLSKLATYRSFDEMINYLCDNICGVFVIGHPGQYKYIAFATDITDEKYLGVPVTGEFSHTEYNTLQNFIALGPTETNLIAEKLFKIIPTDDLHFEGYLQKIIAEYTADAPPLMMAGYVRNQTIVVG